MAFLYTLGFMSLLFTFLPFLRFSNWWIRIGDFPRLQIAFACLLVLIPLSVFRRPFSAPDLVFAGLLALSVAYQFFCIVPYTPFYPKQVESKTIDDPKNTVRLFIANVFIENDRYDNLLKLIERVDPDIVLLAEPDRKWLRKLSSLKRDYAYHVEEPLDNTYGMALYSRFELLNPRLKFLVEPDVPSIHTDFRLPSGHIVRLYSLHPRPPFPTESFDTVERDAELIIVGKELGETDRPAIIAGDLNDVAWSRTTKLFQKISGMLDPRIGRGLFNSFHADYRFIRFPLDHVFHSKHFRLAGLERLPHVGSDHFPIFITLVYEATAEMTQEAPRAEADELKEANEMMDQAIR
jgi:endonuclease/exonuclease/phosphatase (EEP) superfamily protein YafD